MNLSPSPSSASLAQRLLWIVPKWPLPAQDGARIAITSLIQNVAATGVAIDLVTIVSPDEDPRINEGLSELGVRSIAVLRREHISSSKYGRIFQLLFAFLRSPFSPVTMRIFGSGELGSRIRNLLRGQTNVIQAVYPRRPEDYGNWDGVVFDVLHPAYAMASGGLFQRVDIRVAPIVVYRAHNREADIWWRRAGQAGNFLTKWFLMYQARLVERFENSFISGADRVAAVSREELELFSAIDHGVKGGVVPIGRKFDSPLPADPHEELRLMFLGKLDWPPNRDGLIWFLEHVWPEVARQRPEVSLEIAGSGDGDFLKPYLGDAKVSFLGRVPEVDSLYRRSDACIVPVFYGGGTRVKAIEASSFGRACISSALGVEGLGLSSDREVLLAEEKSEWIQKIVEVPRQTLIDYGISANRVLKDRFGEEKAAQEFCNLVFAEGANRELGQTWSG